MFWTKKDSKTPTRDEEHKKQYISDLETARDLNNKYIADLETTIENLRKELSAYRKVSPIIRPDLIKSEALPHQSYNVPIINHAPSKTYGIGHRPGTLRLYSSGFNFSWFDELRLIPEVILDIGTFDCGDSIRFKKQFADCRVYAFEGCPKRFEYIESYAKDFAIELFHYAVCDRTGPVDWYTAEDFYNEGGFYGGQGSLFRHAEVYKNNFPKIRQIPKPTKVQGITIQNFCDERDISRVDLAHVDVEGAELNVIKGFGEIRPSLLFVETILDGKGWVGGTDIREMHAILEDMDYRLAGDFISDRLYVHQSCRRAST